ncbi:diguanylate cyclase [Alteromonas sp. A081]|uniref:diguanylate cyclase n=1 Tax=Alteromonas sp. A081 TaxID=3410269 RepID=UPI003B981A84
MQLWTYLTTALIVIAVFVSFASFAEEENKDQNYLSAPNDDVIKSIKALHQAPEKELARLDILIRSKPMSSKMPEWLYVSALGHEKIGRLDKAETFLQRCLTSPHTGPLLENRAKLLKAKLLSSKGDERSALAILRDVLKWSQNNGITQLKIGTLMTMGTVLKSMSQIELSLDSYFEAYNLASTEKTQVPAAHIAGLIGGMYQQQEDHLSALRYLEESLAFASKKQNIINQGHLSYDVAYSQFKLNNMDDALAAIDNAYRIGNIIDDQSLIANSLVLNARVLVGLGTDKSLVEALQLFSQALVHLPEGFTGALFFEAYLGMANAKYKQRHYQEGIDLLAELQNNGLESAQLEQRIRFFTLEASLYKAQGNYKSAFNTLSRLVELKANYILQQNSTRSDIIKTLFELDKAEKENSELKAVTASQAKALSTSQQRNLLLGISSALLVLLALTLLLFYRKKVRYQYTLEKLASTDSLTRLFNRRKIIEILEHRININNKALNLVVVMVDIDHFKSINDNYGHQRGDETLILFSDEVEKSVGHLCHIGRIGGEEFLLIFNTLSVTDVIKHLVRLQQTLAARATAEFGHQFNLTFSAGVLQVSEASTATSIFEKADQALYLAKEGGRNRVVQYTP